MAFCNMCGAQIADGTTTAPHAPGSHPCRFCRSRCHSRSGSGYGRQRSRDVGLRHHYSGDYFPGDGALQPESIYSLPRFPVLVLCCGADHPSHRLSIFTIVPFLALITFPLHLLVSLGGFILWIVLLLKANQGQMYKLPVIGDLAKDKPTPCKLLVRKKARSLQTLWCGYAL